MKSIVRLLSAAFLLLLVQACTTTGSNSPAASGLPDDPATSPVASTANPDSNGPLVPAIVGIPSDPGPSSTYRISPFDLLKIDVFQVEELSRQERVNENGFIVLPLVGNVKVGGLTPREAQTTLAARLGEEYLQNPQVNIFVLEYSGQNVTVTGKVNSQGMLPLAGRTTLTQVIARAGGMADVAKTDEILIFRKQEGGDINAYVVDYDAIESGKLADPVIVADDRIVVPESGTAVFAKTARGILTGFVSRSIIGL